MKDKKSQTIQETIFSIEPVSHQPPPPANLVVEIEKSRNRKRGSCIRRNIGAFYMHEDAVEYVKMRQMIKVMGQDSGNNQTCTALFRYQKDASLFCEAANKAAGSRDCVYLK